MARWPASIASEIAAWKDALGGAADNPVFLRLDASRRRRTAALHPLRRGLPLVIGAAAGLLMCGVGIFSLHAGGGPDASEFFWTALITFALVSYIVWAVAGLSEAILDVMSVLSRSEQRSYRLQLDDMTAVTGLKDTEVAAGVLRVLLPPLYLRSGTGAVILWLGFVLAQTEFLRQFDSETAGLVAAGPLLVANWMLFGCLGVTLLLLFLLATGHTHWGFTGSIAVASAVFSQGVWLVFGTTLAAVMSVEPFYSSYDGRRWILYLSLIAGPALFCWLVYAGLELCRRTAGFRLLYGSIGPLANPLLAVAALSILLGATGLYNEQEYMMAVLPFIWQFGSLLPLNPPVLFTPWLLTGDWLAVEGDTLIGVLLTALVLLSQLALLVICARYARLAVHARRSGEPG